MMWDMMETIEPDVGELDGWLEQDARDAAEPDIMELGRWLSEAIAALDFPLADQDDGFLLSEGGVQAVKGAEQDGTNKRSAD